MKFSRSLLGYAPIEVERKNKEILGKYKLEKREYLLLLENASKEYDKLIKQHTILADNLKYYREISLYLYNKEVYDNTLNQAERNAFLKVDQIKDEHQRFIETIHKTTEDIDRLLIDLSEEFSAMKSALDKVIESIIKESEISEQSAVSLEYAIDSLSSYEAAAKPFKALDFNTQVTPFLPTEVPVKNSNVTSPLELTKHPKTVVIAENDFETSSVLTYVLEREGFDIILAADGYSLINMIREKEAPGIIILDTLLPYMQPNMLIKQIKESKTWCDVPILITTSEHNKQVTIEALEFGANDSIEKPFNPRELAARVKRLTQDSIKATWKTGGII
jgi:CheY-like chemotaxis protein